MSRTINLDAIRKVVTDTVEEVIEKMNLRADGRFGGYLCLMNHLNDELLIPPELCLEVRNGKDKKYEFFCYEKAHRLSILRDVYDASGNYGCSREVYLSSQSQNPEKGRWPGAIITPILFEKYQLIFSFSGLPPDCDEAAMLISACRTGCLDEEDLKARLSHTENRVVQDNEWKKRYFHIDKFFPEASPAT